MITSLRLVNFKNFADETLRIGPFTVIVGANASGKSNIRDAFRFLHGIGRGYTLAEIFGGKYGLGGQAEWEPIRGTPNEVARIRRSNRPRVRDFSIHIEMDMEGEKTFYSITVRFNPNRPDGFRVWDEELRTDSHVLYTTLKGTRRVQLPVLVGEGERQQEINLTRLQPALTQFSKLRILHRALSEQDLEFRLSLEARLALGSALESIRFLELSPERIREPSIPGATTMGDSGQNLPAVLETICEDPNRKEALMSWLRELTPMDVRDFRFPRDPSGRVHLRIEEKNRRSVSAFSASDGTLRFLGMLASLLGTEPASMYFFEEVDNGIHPNRLWLLLDLIERQTKKNDIQVITTTHSPDVLNFINDETFKHTSVVSRLEDTGDAIIRPLDSLHNVTKLRKSQGLGRLHSSGWMEDILNLEAWKNEDEESGG